MKNNEVSIFDIFNDVFYPRTKEMKSDIKETANEYLVEIEMAGFNKDEITISYNDGYLTIKGIHKNEVEEDKKVRYLRQERTYQSLERSFYIADIDEDNIKAKMENGILSIILPKKVLEAPKTNHIMIE